MTGLPAAALVLTQVAVPQALAAACAVYKLPVDVVPTRIGCVAVCRAPTGDLPERTAGVISGLLTNTTVVLVVRRDGQMSASRWADGKEQEPIPAALMVDGAPPEIERLLLGQVAAADLPGVVTSVGMSRWKATRTLAKAARGARRSRRSVPEAGSAGPRV